MGTKRRGHPKGTIKQRNNGRWEAQISLPAGKRKSFYGKTRKEAQDKLRAGLLDLEVGLDLSTGSLTLGDFLDRWLEASVRPTAKEKTYEGYEMVVRVRIKPSLGRTTLAKLTPLNLQRLYAALTDRGLSGRSVVHTHRCLHRALEQAVRWNMIAGNPCDGVTPPKSRSPEMRVWTPEQAAAFLAAARTHASHALYALALTTGMRQGELLGLRWADVDLEAKRVTVRRSLQRQNAAGLVFVEPKSARSRRMIALSQTAAAALRAHRDRQVFLRQVAGLDWRDQDLVFTNGTGGPLDPSWQRETFYEALRRLDLPQIRFHDLRHTAATIALRHGVHPKVVSDMLGHSTITLTLDTYSHLLPVMHEEAAAAMDRALAG